MKIFAIGFSNFRSVGASAIIVNLEQRINLLVGPNDSGKSNVLEFLRRLQDNPLPRFNLGETDFHVRDSTRPLSLIFDIKADGETLPEGRLRFHFEITGGTISRRVATPFDHLNYRQLEPYMRQYLNRVWGSGVPNDETIGDFKQQLGNHLLGALNNVIPKLHLIPQFRRISAGAEYTIDGTGVTELLGRWQSPEIGKEKDRERFDKVQEFLRQLLSMNDIRLDVSRENSQLLVQRGNLRLPFDKSWNGHSSAHNSFDRGACS